MVASGSKTSFLVGVRSGSANGTGASHVLCKLPLPSSSDEAVDNICWVMREFEQKITSKAHGHSRLFMPTTDGLLLLGNGIQE